MWRLIPRNSRKFRACRAGSVPFPHTGVTAARHRNIAVHCPTLAIIENQLAIGTLSSNSRMRCIFVFLLLAARGGRPEFHYRTGGQSGDRSSDLYQRGPELQRHRSRGFPASPTRPTPCLWRTRTACRPRRPIIACLRSRTCRANCPAPRPSCRTTPEVPGVRGPGYAGSRPAELHHDRAGLTSTASSMRAPTAVASDGVHLVVADTDHNRVLIWNRIPTDE